MRKTEFNQIFNKRNMYNPYGIDRFRKWTATFKTPYGVAINMLYWAAKMFKYKKLDVECNRRLLKFVQTFLTKKKKKGKKNRSSNFNCIMWISK